ncbi:branched-chain amino acid aminotransferase [Granulicoccus sp. GXG6511]|uniref:branched-chain amino acid aminotransferase n=1 Tax=Granulicoccus sp. GXG6511 TaxID=3381351 RepID=UPI003D7D8FC8
MSFTITLTASPRSAAERAAVLADPGFGRHFTDHMATAEWSVGEGWHDLRVRPLEPFAMHPGSGVLHYGQEIFEGLKAYRHPDGSVNLFRPDRNAARFARSARRLALPELPEDLFLQGLVELVKADAAWVPAHGDEASLYLRPIQFASESFLGVRPSATSTFCVVASPAGAYFPGGVRGIKLWVTTKYTRAAIGGTGDIKCGGNYAGSLLAQTEAQEQGCDQVMYTSGPADRRILEEAGTMNLMVVTAEGELWTPGLGTILEGVTRASILELAGEHGLVAREREITLAEFLEGLRNGLITEVFAAGTAAVITPITALAGDGFDLVVGAGAPGEKALALREHLLGIQQGVVEDTRGWVRRVC